MSVRRRERQFQSGGGQAGRVLPALRHDRLSEPLQAHAVEVWGRSRSLSGVALSGLAAVVWAVFTWRRRAGG